jgi:hypothetical protein
VYIERRGPGGGVAASIAVDVTLQNRSPRVDDRRAGWRDAAQCARSRRHARSSAGGLAVNTVCHAFIALYAVCQLGCSSDGVHSDDTPVRCGVRAYNFPSYDKTCTAASDCAIGVHQTDCCGSTLAIGMMKAELARFTADEQECEAQYPRCACSETVTAEDGNNASGKTVAVRCEAGSCMTAIE